MDLKAKHLSDTCSDPIDFLYQLRQTIESIGGGTEYSEEGELVEYDVAIEAVKKANDIFIEKATWWLLTNASDYVALHNGYDTKELVKDFVDVMKRE